MKKENSKKTIIFSILLTIDFAMDVLFPKIGEIIGGSEREADYDKLFSFALPKDDLVVLNAASESYLKYRFEKDFKTLVFYKTISS